MSQVLTYATVVGRELGLQDRMTALRNLRPGTRLSWPEGDLSRGGATRTAQLAGEH